MRLHSETNPFSSDSIYIHSQSILYSLPRIALLSRIRLPRRVMRQEAIETGAFNVLLTHYDLAIRDKAVLRKVSLSLTLTSS